MACSVRRPRVGGGLAAGGLRRRRRRRWVGSCVIADHQLDHHSEHDSHDLDDHDDLVANHDDEHHYHHPRRGWKRDRRHEPGGRQRRGRQAELRRGHGAARRPAPARQSCGAVRAPLRKAPRNLLSARRRSCSDQPGLISRGRSRPNKEDGLSCSRSRIRAPSRPSAGACFCARTASRRSRHCSSGRSCAAIGSPATCCCAG